MLQERAKAADEDKSEPADGAKTDDKVLHNAYGIYYLHVLVLWAVSLILRFGGVGPTTPMLYTVARSAAKALGCDDQLAWRRTSCAEYETDSAS